MIKRFVDLHISMWKEAKAKNKRINLFCLWRRQSADIVTKKKSQIEKAFYYNLASKSIIKSLRSNHCNLTISLLSYVEKIPRLNLTKWTLRRKYTSHQWTFRDGGRKWDMKTLLHTFLADKHNLIPIKGGRGADYAH